MTVILRGASPARAPAPGWGSGEAAPPRGRGGHEGGKRAGTRLSRPRQSWSEEARAALAPVRRCTCAHTRRRRAVSPAEAVVLARAARLPGPARAKAGRRWRRRGGRAGRGRERRRTVRREEGRGESREAGGARGRHRLACPGRAEVSRSTSHLAPADFLNNRAVAGASALLHSAPAGGSLCSRRAAGPRRPAPTDPHNRSPTRTPPSSTPGSAPDPTPSWRHSSHPPPKS